MYPEKSENGEGKMKYYILESWDGVLFFGGGIEKEEC